MQIRKESGTLPYVEMFRIESMLLDAHLDAVATDKDRSEILGNALAAAKKNKAVAAQRAQSGLATPLMALEAKAERLRIEAQLAELAAK